MSDQKTAYASLTFKKDKYAWGFLVLFALVILWGTGELGSVGPVELRSWQAPVSDQATLTVLEFDRVVFEQTRGHVHQDQLRGLLKALDQDGFEAVSVKDIFGFYYKDGKLPEKSLLLIFAHGYLETFSAADPVLREIQWPAAVSLATSRVDKRETFFLYWDRLRRMVDSGIWDVVSAGHRGRERVPAGNKSTARFFTRKFWTEQKPPQESDSEFSARVFEDYKVSRGLIEENIPGTRILAYSPSSLRADFHKQKNNVSLTAAHDRSLKQLFQLSFVDSFMGVNDKTSDPFRLRRLRVQPGWQPDALLSLINKAIQTTAVVTQEAIHADSVWLTGKGELLKTSDSSNLLFGKKLSLVPDPGAEPENQLVGSPGTSIFMPGGNRAENWILETNLRLDRGEFWIGQNSLHTQEEWRLGGGENFLNVQYRAADGQYENLASSRTGIHLGVWHHLRLVKRGKGIIVQWNGETLWDLPVHFKGSLKGDIELQIWSREGEGSMRVSDATVSFLPHDIRWLEPFPAGNAVQFLIRNAEQVSGVTTVTHRIEGDRLGLVSFDKDLFQIISRRYGWDFIPTVRILPGSHSSGQPDYEGRAISSIKGVVPFWISSIQMLVIKNHWTLLHLDLSPWRKWKLPNWFSSLPALEEELKKIGCQLLLTTEGRPGAGQALKLYQPNSKSIGPLPSAPISTL